MEDQRKLNGMALAGFICSIAGFILPIGIILGIIFSAIGMSKTKKQADIYKGRGFAIAGLIIGLVAILWLVAMFIIFVFLEAKDTQSMYYY